MPIVRINGRDVGDAKAGPLTTRLREIYIEFCRAVA